MDHWDRIYGEKSDTDTSWYEPEPHTSLALFDRLGVDPARSVIDLGGGTSSLVDVLLDRGHRDLAVLDLSEHALRRSQQRLGSAASSVDWIVADVTTWQPARSYDVWHDRAVLHFLTTPEQQSAYRRALQGAVAPGGFVVVGTFATDGPTQCSGLPVARHDPQSLLTTLGSDLTLITQERYEHRTPWGSIQPFTWIAAQRGG